MVARALTKGLEEKCKKHHVGGKLSFITGGVGWPILPAGRITNGRMFIWSDGAGGLEKSELPLWRAFIFLTALPLNQQTVGFDPSPNGGLSTIWTGGFEALHCLTCPPYLALTVFSPLYSSPALSGKRQ